MYDDKTHFMPLWLIVIDYIDELSYNVVSMSQKLKSKYIFALNKYTVE